MTIPATDDAQAALAAAAKRLVAEIEARGSEVVAQIAAEAHHAINDKRVFVDTITKERATWRSELRSVAASLIALLRTSRANTTFDFVEVHRLRAGIILRLNPAGRSDDQTVRDAHPHDRDLHSILDELWIDSGSPREEHTALAARIEQSVQALLKQEWSVSKNEAITGKIAGSDAAPVPATAS